MSNGPIRLGIIGAGSIGTLHSETAARAGVDIHAVCDTREGKAARLADQYDARKYLAIDEILADDDVNLVVIGLPNHEHKDAAIKAMEAGKAVVLEKPMAMSVTECDEIIAARDQTGAWLQMGFVCRGTPTAMAAKDLVDNGALGNVYHVRAVMHRRRGIPGLGRWFTDKSKSGGGVLIDVGVHFIDLALHLTGRPALERLTATCSSRFGVPIENYSYEEMWAGPPDPKGVYTVEDGAIALMHHAGGMTFELHVTWADNVPLGTVKEGMTIMGDKGGCYFDLWSDKVEFATERDGRLVDASVHAFNTNPWAATWDKQYERIIDCRTNNKPPTATGEHGREVQSIIEALYRSSDEGREVRFD